MSNDSQPVSDRDYLQSFVDLQGRNMKAVADAQQKLLVGMGLLAKQQAQAMDAALRSAIDSAQKAAAAPDWRVAMAGRIDDVKAALVQMQATTNAGSEIVMRSLGDVAGTLQTRLMDALDEAKAALTQAQPASLTLAPRAGAIGGTQSPSA
jgi:hypothetical protein